MFSGRLLFRGLVGDANGLAIVGLAFPLLHLEGLHALGSEIGDPERRGNDHTQLRPTVFDQRDIDGELPVALDNLLGPI